MDNDTPLAMCACTAVRSASRSITQLYNLVLSPIGLRATQFTILWAISQEGEVAQSHLARAYAISVDTLSRQLGILRRKRLVRDRKGPSRNEHLYSLTEEGWQAVHKAMAYWVRAQERLRRTMGESQWNSLFRLCEQLVTAAHRAEDLRVRNGLNSCIKGDCRGDAAVISEMQPMIAKLEQSARE